MNNDRHGESCAREVGARVDATETREQPAVRTETRNARRSSDARRDADASPPLTSDWNLYRSHLLRVFFRDAGALAGRYRVGGEDLVAHVRARSSATLERGALLKPVACIGDLTVATACCLGRANAMNELWIYAEPAMTRAALSRLPETLALTWTRRYWTRLERASREGAGLALYDGSRPIRLWIVEQLLGTLEEERSAGRLEIRREHLGRPAALRLVGELLA